jgi:hypothetical protein
MQNPHNLHAALIDVWKTCGCSWGAKGIVIHAWHCPGKRKEGRKEGRREGVQKNPFSSSPKGSRNSRTAMTVGQ